MALSISVFDYLDYKKYLDGWMESHPGKGRGLRSELAEALACQSGYVSRVLSGDAHFSPEQADRINAFVGHTGEEAQFFMLLVQWGRAGTESLRGYVREQINAILEKRLVLKDRLKIEKTFKLEDQPIYFSAWYYAGVHVALTIPELRTRDAIAAYLGLPIKRVSEVLEFLVSVGLAAESKGKYQVGPARMHLGSDSPMISKHHANWRLQALQSLEGDLARDLHYSSVVTITEEDALKIKNDLVAAIERAKAVIKESKEEGIYCFTLDFFSLSAKA